jgi:hypothetical protein
MARAGSQCALEKKPGHVRNTKTSSSLRGSSIGIESSISASEAWERALQVRVRATGARERKGRALG